MDFPLWICILGVIVFAVPLLFIIQDIVNSFKLAADDDPKVASVGWSVFLIICNIIFAIGTLIGLGFFIRQLWLSLTTEPILTDATSDDGSVPATFLLPTASSAGAASLPLEPAVGPMTFNFNKRLKTVHKDDVILQIGNGDLHKLDDNTAKNVREMIEKIKEAASTPVVTRA